MSQKITVGGIPRVKSRRRKQRKIEVERVPSTRYGARQLGALAEALVREGRASLTILDQAHASALVRRADAQHLRDTSPSAYWGAPEETEVRVRAERTRGPRVVRERRR